MSTIPQEMLDYSIYLNEVAARDEGTHPLVRETVNGGSQLFFVSVGCR